MKTIGSLVVMGGTLLYILLLSGCGETREVTLYMQDLEVQGPAGNLPLQITRNPEAGEFHVTPHVGFSSSIDAAGSIDGHTAVNTRGVYQVDTVYNGSEVTFVDPGNVNTIPFSGSNLHRKFPSAVVGLDVDFGVSRITALSVGVHYSSLDGTGLTGYHAGIAFRQHRGNTALRLDVGWQWEEFLYEAFTIVTDRPLSSQSATVSFYRDKRKSSQGKLYGALTINSTNPDWYLRPFLQLGMMSQGITDIRPSAPQSEPWIVPPFFIAYPSAGIVNDKRREFRSTQFVFTPGMTTDLDESLSVIIGVAVNVETNIDSYSRSVMIVPVVRLDWRM